jgi:hypothetical protein
VDILEYTQFLIFLFIDLTLFNIELY